MKAPPRKGKRRTVLDVKTPRRHRDSLDVFNLLAEDAGSQGPEGWFSIPWRDGRNAIALVKDLSGSVPRPRGPSVVPAVNAMLINEEYQDVYWLCDDLREEVARTDISVTLQTLCILRLRLLQLLVSNSHGGGHGYNTVLLHGWHKLDLDATDAAGAVAEHRAADALGTLDNVSPRRASAFREAWQAGLFRAAYALARGPR